ncbi:MAG: ABC transporter permease [Clostridiales bacterium]|nr:MAG: ABC transporter permease [Clostridiales bacterium]
MGNEIKINGRNFKIVGVMEEQADSTESSDDDAIIIPYTIAQKLSGTFAISAYTFCAANQRRCNRGTGGNRKLSLQNIQRQRRIQRYEYVKPC